MNFYNNSIILDYKNVFENDIMNQLTKTKFAYILKLDKTELKLYRRNVLWDTQKSDANKSRLRELFNGVMEDGDSYDIVYGYGLNIKNSDYIVARKKTYTYTSLIIGYRETDMSIALLQTTPELEGCSEAEIFRKDNIKKAKIATGMYTIYHQGGLMAGYTQFATLAENDEKFLAYVYQPEEYDKFDTFFKKFSGR